MVKLNYTEKLTFEEWEQIRKELKQEKREEKKALRTQKTMGFILVLLSVLCPVLLQDITASVFLFPLGVGVMVTKDKVI